jgi:hypothetical protein
MVLRLSVSGGVRTLMADDEGYKLEAKLSTG